MADITQFPAPTPTGKISNVQLTGMWMPWFRDEPTLNHMMGVGAMVFYLPLFDEVEQLLEILTRAEVPFDSIKRVKNGPEFLSDVPPDVIIITNLHFTPEGRIRYTQVDR